MGAEAWIAIVTFLGTVIANAVVCSFFFGRLSGRVRSNQENCDKHGKRLDDHDRDIFGRGGLGERVTRLEERRKTPR